MALSTDEFKYISDLVYKHAAIVLDEKKKYLVESRLAKVMSEEYLWTATELVSKLKELSGLKLRARIVDAMTVNESSFFRNGHPFEELRQNLIPELNLFSSVYRPETVANLALTRGYVQTGGAPNG